MTVLTVMRLYSIDDRIVNEYGVVCEVKVGKRNRNIRRKPAPVMPNVLTWDRTRAITMRRVQ